MNLAFKYPIMFWNCACLISDAGGADFDDECDDEGETEEKEEVIYESCCEEFTDDDSDDDEEEDEEETLKNTPKKKKAKTKATNYGKIASAIGKICSTGVTVMPPDINKSTFTFSPDIAANAIRYGFSGITRIGNDLIKIIMENRPYTSLNDFLNKININKPQMINLIKSGAFDGFGDRVELMHQYINEISDTKKRITMQNMKMLIDFDLIPAQYDLQKRVYNFNKYLKKDKRKDAYYTIDDIAFGFYSQNFDIDKLEPEDDHFVIKQTNWDTIYNKQMAIVKPYVQANANNLLEAVNNKLTKDVWEKYCSGNLSKWEMDSISCYIHEHELINIDKFENGLSDFDDLPEEMEIDKIAHFKGKSVPIYRLRRIAGTVLDRDKAKKTVTLLTTSGVVLVKVYGAFQEYDKQISERGADGKKHVLEKSSFSRGNKIIVTGVRDGDSFLAKKYKTTSFHRIEIIDSIEDNGIIHTRTRGED